MDLDKLILFTGRFHPIVVHLPIGFLLIVFILDGLSMFKRFENFRFATPIILLLGFISSILAAIMGYLLSLGGGYDEKILFWHQWLGIAVAVISFIAYVFKRISMKKASPAVSNTYMILLSITVVLLMIAGHYGGSLTHGSEYLTEHAPSFSSDESGDTTKKSSVKKVKNVKEALLYNDVLQPILDEKCISCHNAGKKKGGLRLDNAVEMMKGGDKGLVIIPGKVAQSEFYHRLVLPEDNKGHMPPKGKTPLTDKEMELFAWWINEGAPTDKKIAQLTLPGNIETEVKKMLNVGNEKSGIFLLKVPKADERTINALNNRGILTTRLSEETSFLNIQMAEVADTFKDEHLKLLVPVTKQVTWLHLGSTKISDNGLASVGKMENLTRLYLQNTNITDAGLKHIEGLKYLEYLNLYGTQVTDNGLQSLLKLKNLKTLFLWKTPVTVKGISMLQQKLPGIKINFGLPKGPQSYMELSKEWKFKKGDNAQWATAKTNDNTWDTIEVGKKWQDEGYKHQGYAWYRLKIFMPDTLQKYIKKEGDIKLLLGKIDDVDETFLNGKMIGHTGKVKPYATAYDKSRVYILHDEDILWNQDNLIAIRVYSPDDMGGGMVAGPHQLYVNIDSANVKDNPAIGAVQEVDNKIVLAFDEGSCCDKAHKAGKKCEHACCVEAAKNGKVCADCNPKSKN